MESFFHFFQKNRNCSLLRKVKFIIYLNANKVLKIGYDIYN